jgi:hypothetical protein
MPPSNSHQQAVQSHHQNLRSVWQNFSDTLLSLAGIVMDCRDLLRDQLLTSGGKVRLSLAGYAARMLHKCWSCKTPLPLRAHDGRWLDHGHCPVCGANQPLTNFRRSIVWAVLIFVALVLLFHISRG